MGDDALKSPEMAGEPAKKTDVLLLHSRTEDGEGVRVIRARNDTIETGELRAMKEGRPISGEVVKLTPREKQPGVCDVEVLAEVSPKAPGEHAGPARVATTAYRESWDRIFGANEPDASLN